VRITARDDKVGERSAADNLADRMTRDLSVNMPPQFSIVT
jgi:hypothetical protein